MISFAENKYNDVIKIQVSQTFLRLAMITLFGFAGLDILAQHPAITPGDLAPPVELKNVDDQLVSLDNYPDAKGFIIIFIANGCPYSKAYEQRIMDLDKKFSPLFYPVIAINSNDPVISPGDSFIKMKQRAKARKYSFPYLSDKEQVVADKYGARSTPQVFIISKTDSIYRVEYTGAIDNDVQNKNPGKINYTEDAVLALLNNRKPVVTVTKSISCSISRKRQ